MSETTTPHVAKWETITNDGNTETFRLAVPGGWLYRVVTDCYEGYTDSYSARVNVVFVPEEHVQGVGRACDI